jgi:hypothetical protein
VRQRIRKERSGLERCLRRTRKRIQDLRDRAPQRERARGVRPRHPTERQPQREGQAHQTPRHQQGQAHRRKQTEPDEFFTYHGVVMTHNIYE